MDKKINRREFLKLAGLAGAAATLAACTPATTAAPTTAPKPTDTTAPKATAVPPTATKVPPTATAVPPTATATPQPGGTLITARGGDSVLLDTYGSTDGESWRVAGAIIDPLVSLADPDPTKVYPVPWLAESFSSPDGKVWTFKIRKDVKFHDGTVCDAAAVKWNFDRWASGAKGEFTFGLAGEYYNTEFVNTNPITDTTAVDALTVQITLTTPSAVMLYKLPLASFAISSPDAIKKQGNKYGTQAGTLIGTGPFIFKEWVPNDKITVVKNPDWWNKGLPKIDGQIWRSIPDNAARLAAFIAGECHTADLAQTDMDTAAADPNIATYTGSPMSVGYISFQQCTKPFDNVDVRWAVAHAINREAIFKTFFNPGRGDLLATCFQPPAILGSNPDVGPIEYNPDTAKQLLAKAGLKDGFKTDFWYIPVIRGYFPESKAIGEAIAVDLNKVGIQVSLKTQDWGAYLDARLKGKFPMWMLGWGSDNGDPDNFIGWHFSHPVGKPKEEDCYNNDKLAQLLIDGAKEPDVAKREAIYKQCEQMVHDDMARLPFVWTNSIAFYRKEVQDVRIDYGYDTINHIWIKK